MKTLYLDCGMGAAGDMLTGALLGLLDEAGQTAFLRDMNAALAGRAVIAAVPDVKRGVTGTHVSVTVDGKREGEHEHHHEHHHHHSGIREIRALLKSLNFSERVKGDALAVFDSIAAAEAQVHGQEPEHIHFHELGTLDAVADVLGVCLLMERLNPARVLASPVNAGGGTVQCAHGVLPVPAPATELLLRGVPWYEGEIKTELCTPTGAALLRRFVARFGDMPPMLVDKCAYGTGTKDFGRLNAVRALLGQTAEGEAAEELVELCCNLDDMSGEELGFARERLFEAGALDVWTAPIGMKKGRPGVLLSALCRKDRRAELLQCLFRHTTTLGVREYPCRRHSLDRSFTRATTPWGAVTVKRAKGYGVARQKPEYEDLARLARENDLTLREVREHLK